MCCVTCLCDPRVSLNSNMAACVEELLAKAQRDEEEKLKSITVTKELELTFDVGHLLACDSNRVEARALKEDKEQFLRSLARDNTQLLINEVWKLRAERLQEALVVKLPETHTPLPRAKPPPKVRAITKWEEFAKLKGIQKRKKTNLVWDENAKDWKRRWGYQRGGDDTKEWLIEVPVTAANTEDQFEKRSHAKKERVAKNEFNRLKNIARAQKIKVPGVGLTPVVSQGKDDLSRAVSVARTSTASAGRFQDRLPKEKAPKNQGKKRKFDAVIGNFSSEKQKQLDLLKLMDGKRPKLDVTKAVNKQMREEDQEEAQKYKKGKKGGRKGGGSFGGKGGKGGGGKGGKGKEGGSFGGKGGGGGGGSFGGKGGGGGSFGGKGKGGGGMGGKGKGKGGKPGKAKGKGGKGAVVGGKRRGKPGKR